MATEIRKSESAANTEGIGTGPYLAKVVSHLDPSFMGGLEVTLLRNQGNMVGDENQSYTVKYMTPFFGSTAFEHMGSNKGNDDAFNDTQKSYGMWFTPPDVGVTVLVVFVDGNPAEGYWIGCVPGRFTNNMIPAIGGTDVNDATADQKKKYATKQPLPVAEVNRRANDLEKSTAIDKIKKPVHPIADRFLEQGLLEDDVRGTTTSTVRREVPNMVFGILTPGPLDKRDGSKKAFVGRKQSKTEKPVPVSRLGGTQMVFDDGDDRYQRKKPAGEGPVEYADILNGEKGDPNIPYNEYFRVRTRTGHQILLHNSEDLIYIGNAKGTTWIELTSNGKIDIFAEDSVSIHTKNDLNIRADRDLNLEAGRNINLRAAGTHKSGGGRLHADLKSNLELVVGENSLITTTGNLDFKTTGNNKLSAGGTSDIKSGGDLKIGTGGGLHIKSGGASTWTGGGQVSIGGSAIVMSGGSINLNGPAAPAAADAVEASAAKALPLRKNIVTDGTEDWAKTKYQKGTLESIMKRIPMHEPWALHENMAPSFVGPGSTDRETE